jgi:hypothetical protein
MGLYSAWQLPMKDDNTSPYSINRFIRQMCILIILVCRSLSAAPARESAAVLDALSITPPPPSCARSHGLSHNTQRTPTPLARATVHHAERTPPLATAAALAAMRVP